MPSFVPQFKTRKVCLPRSHSQADARPDAERPWARGIGVRLLMTKGGPLKLDASTKKRPADIGPKLFDYLAYAVEQYLRSPLLSGIGHAAILAGIVKV
jgi:hypothetical protein